MYYSSGNYEAFARPAKPEGIEDKSAYIVGTGLAGLSAACYLIRDAQMDGSRVHLFERDAEPGGACDGWEYPQLGFTMRGGREMDNHFEVMWDLFRSIPSIEDENMSILDYYYQLNKRDPNYSLCRATVNRGEDAGLDNTFNLSDKACMEIMNLFFTPEEQLDDKPITDYFSDDVLDSNFWLYWRTMFAFENWHSALEMKRYIQRFVHHVGGLPDFSALRFTRYNQFESLILPMVNYLKGQGVQIHLNTEVVDITFSSTPERKVATEVQTICEGADKTFHLTDDDLLFITNGSCVANSSFGSQDEPARFNAVLEKGTGFDLWRRIARQDSAFGNPEKFIGDPEKSNWMSATVTTLDEKIVPYIESICRRDPFSGGVVTGGIVTVKDSNWLLSWTFNRQPQFRAQPGDQLCGWIYGLFTDVPGNYVKKPVVPEGAVNFAFIGQFAETPRDTIFTTEYSMRTGMEAVYTLCNVDRGVPEVWGSAFDIRDLLNATTLIRDGKPITDMEMNPLEKLALREGIEKMKGTDLYGLLVEFGVIPPDRGDAPAPATGAVYPGMH